MAVPVVSQVTMTDIAPTTAPPPAPAVTSGPIPMSFPAILRNPGFSERFAHLRDPGSGARSAPASKSARARTGEKEGKRWVRRSENARFVHNPHVVHPTRKDYLLPLPHLSSTFPKPLPPYLPRTAPLPTRSKPAREPVSANAGRFSLGLKGMRRELRRAGPRAQRLVQAVESELQAWLEGGVVMQPEDVQRGRASERTEEDGEGETKADEEETRREIAEGITEVSSTVHQLIWSTGEDAFARYVVHCCARYHEVVSFSKEVDGQRLTHLLRPNVTRPDFRAPLGVATPPATDLSSVAPSAYDSESEIASLSGSDASLEPDSDADGDAGGHPLRSSLSAIAESRPASAQSFVDAPAPLQDDSWSVISGSDIDDGDREHSLVRSIQSLALTDDAGPASPSAEVEERAPVVDSHSQQGETEVTPRPLRQTAAMRAHLWDRTRRSASSPSRSPARSPARRPIWRSIPQPKIDPPTTEGGRRSFFDYLYS